MTNRLPANLRTRRYGDRGSADVGYRALHVRVARARGKASGYLCEGGCQGRAADWATVHGRDGLDVVRDYVPLCKGCHAQYDDKPVPRGCGRKLGPQSPEHIEKRAAAARGRKRGPQSPEHRANMAAAVKRSWASRRVAS